jgi:hypothetical protein
MGENKMDKYLKIISDNFNQVIDLIRLHYFKIFLSLTLLSWILILLPDEYARIDFKSLRSAYKEIIELTAILSTFLLIIGLLYKLIGIVYHYIRGIYELKKLTPMEIKRIYQYHKHGTQTFTFFLTDGVVDRMVEKGLIYKARSKSNKVGQQDFHMYSWIYNKIETIPNLEEIKKEDVNDKIQ